MATTLGRALADSLAAHMGYGKVEVIVERTPEEICCGNPKNQDRDAHPWTEMGEDFRGDVWFTCLVCGATDVD